MLLKNAINMFDFLKNLVTLHCCYGMPTVTTLPRGGIITQNRL